MIPFLIVTAIINVALGYALAVYLGKASLPTWHELFATPAPANDATNFVEPLARFPRDRSPTIVEDSTLTPVAQAAERPEDEAPRSATASPQAGAEPFAHADMMEQELLAGIEEFRNQLSKLKGQGVAGILLDTASLDAAR